MQAKTRRISGGGVEVGIARFYQAFEHQRGFAAPRVPVSFRSDEPWHVDAPGQDAEEAQVLDPQPPAVLELVNVDQIGEQTEGGQDHPGDNLRPKTRTSGSTRRLIPPRRRPSRCAQRAPGFSLADGPDIQRIERCPANARAQGGEGQHPQQVPGHHGGAGEEEAAEYQETAGDQPAAAAVVAP